MNWTLDIHDDALSDIDEAAAWYEKREAGLGAEFARTVRLAIDELSAAPLLYKIRSRKFEVRWFLPPRFPYRIIYRIDGDVVRVFAITHSARHDQVWKKRLQSGQS